MCEVLVNLVNIMSVSVHTPVNSQRKAELGHSSLIRGRQAFLASNLLLTRLTSSP